MRCPRRIRKRVPAVDRFGAAPPANTDLVDFQKVMSDSTTRRVVGKGQRQAGLLAERLQPCRKVHRVADHRIGQACARPEIADHHRAAGHTDADGNAIALPGIADLGGKPPVDGWHMVLQGNRRGDGAVMVIRLRNRRIPERHHTVTDEFVQRALMRHDHFAGLIEDDIDQTGQDLRAC